MAKKKDATWYNLVYEFFRPHIRTRGNQYFKEGRVHLQKAEEDWIKGIVSGAQEYDVEIIADTNRFRVFCSCPHFARGEACKHLWAAARQADFLLAKRESSGEHLPMEVTWRTFVTIPERNTGKDFPNPGECCPYYRLDFLSGDWRLLAWQRYICKDGRQGKRAAAINHNVLDNEDLPESDQLILSTCISADHSSMMLERTGIVLDLPYISYLLPFLARTGRCSLSLQGREVAGSLSLGEPYTAEIVYEGSQEDKNSGSIRLFPRIVLGGKRVELTDVSIFISAEPILFVYEGALHALPDVPWEAVRERNASVSVPEEELPEMMQVLADTSRLERVHLPQGFNPEQITGAAPNPRLVLELLEEYIRGQVYFDYEGLSVSADNSQDHLFDRPNWRLISRWREEEDAHLKNLRSKGFEPDEKSFWSYPFEGDIAGVLRGLNALGWELEGKNRKPVRGGAFGNIRVQSGEDWFDLQGEVDFGEDVFIPLPEALEAYRRGQHMITLDDGSFGVLPEKWLAENGFPLFLGNRVAETDGKKDKEGEKLRFSRAQGALLASIDQRDVQIETDPDFSRLCEKIQSFEGIKDKPAPKGLQATLRDYQIDGLSWLQFLREFGLGGILADDMGLGKTIQVLAQLLAEKEGGNLGQSLIVAPTSLALNWIQEADNFTPDLSLHLHAGTYRMDSVQRWEAADIIVTTYTLLRMDIELFCSKKFDYIVLDESQAIKNANTQTAQCTRKLNGNSKLCLTGTPLENHARELWSQMEFLNPGILGSVKGFESLFDEQQKVDEKSLAKFHKCIRPFLLRRSKEEVIQDLPPKMEKVVNCEMTSEQKRMYEQVRDHFRSALLSKVEEKGMAKSKMYILEGLLRLRQIACHPVLAGAEANAASGKLQELKSHVLEVIASGHKALVFSQFTRFLSLIKKGLEAEGVEYCYLDGRTPPKRRQKRVEKFQSPHGPSVFLISIKAGGTGLNLTAADYVFIADPWWNPAVEMQAVDRTHRIGQNKKVFTYRLVTNGTVEEKIRALQEQKQELVRSVLQGSSSSVVRNLSREDLQVLFS